MRPAPKGQLLQANRHRHDPDRLSLGHPVSIQRYYHAMALMETGQLAKARELLDALAAEGFEYNIDEERFRILLAELSGDTAGTIERGRRAMATIEGYTGVHQTQSIQCVAALEALACANLLNARWQPCAEAAREALAIAGASSVGNWIAPPLLAQLAEAELGLGEIEAARRTHAQARDAGPRDARTARPCACAPGYGGVPGATRIRRDLDDALALCDRNGTPAWEPLIREEAARLHALCGESHPAAQEKRAALELYTNLGATGHAARLRGKLAS